MSTTWVNKSPLNLAALLLDLQRKKRSHKTLRCLVYGLQLSSRNPPSRLEVVNSLLILSNISRNICSFLFLLWFSADSVCHHTPSLCHPRNFICMHWKTKIILPVPTFWSIVVKLLTPPQPTSTAPAEPELVLSLHCFHVEQIHKQNPKPCRGEGCEKSRQRSVKWQEESSAGGKLGEGREQTKTQRWKLEWRQEWKAEIWYL